MYVDAHCHLERETYGDELPDVLERAYAADFSHLVAVGASRVLQGAHEAVALAAREARVFATCGVHPHDAGSVDGAVEAELATLLGAPGVVALGEVGLDYYYDNSPREAQRTFFAKCLRMAEAASLPIMLHIRDAHDECFEILDEVGVPAAGGVVHCFTAGPDEAEAYLSRGMHLSIPGVVTFKNAAPLRQAVAMIPDDRFLLETDCPYLAPVPYRGRRNEPSYMVATADRVGELRGRTGAEVGEQARQNSIRLYRLPSL